MRYMQEVGFTAQAQHGLWEAIFSSIFLFIGGGGDGEEQVLSAGSTERIKT